jgi:hypothetical protein
MAWLSLVVGLIELLIFGAMVYYNSEHKFFIFDATAASLLLTAAAVVLTGTAVMVAVAGWFSYVGIKGAAEKAAREEAHITAEDVARSVAARVARETPVEETSPDDADQVAQSYRGD